MGGMGVAMEPGSWLGGGGGMVSWGTPLERVPTSRPAQPQNTRGLESDSNPTASFSMSNGAEY